MEVSRAWRIDWPWLTIGDKCMYRHALPPGFVLKSEKKAAEELAKKEQISLEEFLEVEVGGRQRGPGVYS